MNRYLFFSLVLIVLLFASCVKKPEAGFEVSSQTVFVGEDVYFMNTSDDYDNVMWNFGDSITSLEDTPSHIYTSPGKYTVMLIAYAKNGKKEHEISKEIEVISTTKELIAGIWRLKKIYNSQHDTLTHMVNNVFPCQITIDENSNIVSTAGPLFLYVSFGNWKYSQFMDSLNTFFNYEGSATTTGSMSVEELSTIEHFSLHMNIQLDHTDSWNYIFQEAGYNPVALENSIIKFDYSNIAIDISDSDPDKMIWKFVEGTIPVYTCTDTSGLSLDCPSMYDIDLISCDIVFERE